MIETLPDGFMVMIAWADYFGNHENIWLIRVKDWNRGAREKNITHYPNIYLGRYREEDTELAREKAKKILDEGKFQIQCLAFDMK